MLNGLAVGDPFFHRLGATRQRAHVLRLGLVDRVHDDGRPDRRDGPRELRPLPLHPDLGVQRAEHEPAHVEVHRPGPARRGDGHRDRPDAHADGAARGLAHPDPPGHRRGPGARHGPRHRPRRPARRRLRRAPHRRLRRRCASGWPSTRPTRSSASPACPRPTSSASPASTPPRSPRPSASASRSNATTAAARPCGRSPRCPRSPAHGATSAAASCSSTHYAFPVNGLAMSRPDWIRPGHTRRQPVAARRRAHRRARARPAGQGAVRLQHEPRRRRRRPAARARGPAPRGPLLRRRRAVPHRHRPPRRHRAAEHDAGRADRPRLLVGPAVPDAQPAGGRAARRGRLQPRDVRPARRGGWASTTRSSR